MELLSFDPKNFMVALLVLISGCMAFEDSQPVIAHPSSVSSEIIQSEHSFLIELKDDNTTWYSVSDDNTAKSPQKVDKPIRKNLAKLIAEFKQKHAGIAYSFLIKGENKVKYDAFENVVGALRDNKEYKYSLLPDDQETRMNLPKPEKKDLELANTDKKLTLILIDHQSIYAYDGRKIENGNKYNYIDIHDVIVTASKKYGKEFVTVIKPGNEATYQNTVDILDEMTINKIKRYVMLPMNAEEETFIKKHYPKP